MENYLNNLHLNNTSEEINSDLSNLDISNINNNRDHYLCTQCLKFPYIKFCKDKKHIRLTCSCFNNKKILIKDLYEKNLLYIENKSNINLLSTTNLNLNDDIENKLKCKEHNYKLFYKFECFSKIYLENYCHYYKNEHHNKIKDKIIDFDDIKIEDIKIKQLLKKINNNNKPLGESNNETITIYDKNNGICEILSKEEEYNFNKLINIIINDYKNYPNFSHFFNIKNLLFFFNIEDKQIIEKEEKN